MVTRADSPPSCRRYAPISKNFSWLNWTTPDHCHFVTPANRAKYIKPSLGFISLHFSVALSRNRLQDNNPVAAVSGIRQPARIPMHNTFIYVTKSMHIAYHSVNRNLLVERIQFVATVPYCRAGAPPAVIGRSTNRRMETNPALLQWMPSSEVLSMLRHSGKLTRVRALLVRLLMICFGLMSIGFAYLGLRAGLLQRPLGRPIFRYKNPLGFWIQTSLGFLLGMGLIVYACLSLLH